MKKIVSLSFFSLQLITALLCGFEAAEKNFVCIDCEHVPFVRQSKQDYSPRHQRVAPRQTTFQGTSTNWSGYAALTNLSHPQNNAVTQVSGQWTIPELVSTPNNAYCAVWVGIDGYNSNTVEQLGTEQSWYLGEQFNYAWYEMYPGQSNQIVGFPANTGDVISAEVKYLGNNLFRLSMKNHTVGVIHSFSITTSLSGQTANRSSAEWIIEAPFSGGILPLAHFTPDIAFTNCSATINGKKGSISNTNWQHDAITMETTNGKVKSSVSGLGAGGKTFTARWHHE